MGPVQAIRSALTNYVNFFGRARRSEFWWFALFACVPAAILGATPRGSWGVGTALVAIWYLALVVPSLAVQVRRLHDTGRSGLWLLVSLVPVLGALALLVLSLLDSQPGTNRWGVSPKYPQGPGHRGAAAVPYPHQGWGQRGAHE